jgi:lysophospholipase L1-like esterase
MRSFLPKGISIISFALLCTIVSAGLLAGCTKRQSSAGTSVVTPLPPVTASPLTYLALGDSYTIGQSVLANERFPYLLAQSLKASGVTVSDPQYIATTGWTTADLEAAIATQNPASNYGLVSLLIGVNDQYQHKDTAEYRIRFTRLLQKAISFASGKKDRVFVLSIPDYSATPYVNATDKARVSTEIGYFNSINRQVTEQEGVSYTDITPLTLEAANDPSLLASDKLHYAAKEHQKWVDLLAPAVKNAVK